MDTGPSGPHGPGHGRPGRTRTENHCSLPASPVLSAPGGSETPGVESLPSVRREPGGDAARRGRAHRGGRGPDEDDSAGVAARAPPPRPGLPLPGLPAAVRAGPSPPSLGAGWPNDALEPRHNVAGTTARCMRRAIRSSDSPTARCSSGDRTASCCPTFRPRPGCPPIRSRRSARSTRRRGSASTRARPARPGWGSAWMWATR